MPRPVPFVLAQPVNIDGRPILRFHGDPAPLPPPSVERLRPGLTFAGQDYLGLAEHPIVQAAARIDRAQAHDGSTVSPMIASRIAAILQLPGAVTFPSGEDAIRQTLSTLLTAEDHVLIDAAAPQAIFETACASGGSLHRFPAGSFEAVERRLHRIAPQRRRGRLVIVVPAVSETASKIWDLAELSELSRTYGALLVVDTSHDFGAMGQDGGGVMEIQGCLGRADIVLGTLANCFGAPGGFAAFRDPDLLAALRHVAQPLSPGHARTIFAATDIAFSAEGDHRRRLLHRMSLRLRNHLMADGAWVMGKASPFVPILLPANSARHRAALLESAGPRVRLLEAPTVPRHAPRWKVELSALHSPADIDDLAELIRDVSRAFDRQPSRARVAA